jgi:RNA polymerase sigma-70 factor, ECF subfamily
MMSPALYEKLYTDCYAQAYHRAYYLLHQREDAEDATQAAYVEVWKQWPRLEPTGLYGYLYRAVTHKAINMLRDKRPVASLEADQIDPYVLWDVDTALDISVARAGLSQEQQLLVTLREQGYTWQEIMERQGLSFGQLSKRLYRARVRLRQEVAA